MFNEQQNFAIVQTELDTVYFQQFQYDGSQPGIATANTAAIFKPLTTEHAAYIGEVNKATGLYPVIGETQTVPLTTPHVANKYTILIKDFASGIQISKDLYDDKLGFTIVVNKFRELLENPIKWAISSQALLGIA